MKKDITSSSLIRKLGCAPLAVRRMQIYHASHVRRPIDALLQSLSSGLDPAKSSLSVTCSSKRVLGGPYAVKQMVSLQVRWRIGSQTIAAKRKTDVCLSG